MGIKAGAAFKDFRRFYGRSIDKTVDNAINQIGAQLPTSLTPIKPVLETIVPIAKIAFRVAYDVGEKDCRRQSNGDGNECSDTVQ